MALTWVDPRVQHAAYLVSCHLTVTLQSQHVCGLYSSNDTFKFGKPKMSGTVRFKTRRILCVIEGDLIQNISKFKIFQNLKPPSSIRECIIFKLRDFGAKCKSHHKCPSREIEYSVMRPEHG